MSWTIVKVEKLKNLWSKGHTASQIAEMLGETTKRPAQSMSRKSKFQSILLDKDFESEKPTSLENLTDNTCKWPIGHPDEENFYFCGRSPEGEFPYCKLHVLYAFQPKGQKEDLINKEDDVPAFLEKKIKSA